MFGSGSTGHCPSTPSVASGPRNGLWFGPSWGSIRPSSARHFIVSAIGLLRFPNTFQLFVGLPSLLALDALTCRANCPTVLGIQKLGGNQQLNYTSAMIPIRRPIFRVKDWSSPLVSHVCWDLPCSSRGPCLGAATELRCEQFKLAATAILAVVSEITSTRTSFIIIIHAYCYEIVF